LKRKASFFSWKSDTKKKGKREQKKDLKKESFIQSHHHLIATGYLSYLK
jgi:hypothetical protein